MQKLITTKTDRKSLGGYVYKHTNRSVPAQVGAGDDHVPSDWQVVAVLPVKVYPVLHVYVATFHVRNQEICQISFGTRKYLINNAGGKGAHDAIDRIAQRRASDCSDIKIELMSDKRYGK